MISITQKSILTLLLLLSFVGVKAQLEGGVKIGVSTYDYVNPDFSNLTLFDDRNIPEYNLGIENVNFGFHGGLYGRLTVWKLFLQLEALANSASVDYKVTDLTSQVDDIILREQYTNLDVPVQLGFKLSKWFNIHGGINGHLPISTISELRMIDGYDITPQDFTYSFLGGIGFDIWKLRFDTRFELNSSLFGSEINYKGNTYVFADSDNRIIASIAYSF